MKYLVFIVAVCGILLWSFRDSNKNYQTVSDPFKQKYIRGFKELNNTCSELKSKAAHGDKITLEEYYQLRQEIKQIEHWMAYLDEAFYVQHINGAPLPKLDPDVPHIALFQPKGLQRIDELMFEDGNTENLHDQLSKLSIQLTALYNRHKSLTFQQRYLYEACRRQLVRIFTLGITGFDTPASQHALEDCITSLTSMKEDILLSDIGVNREISKLLDDAVNYIRKNNDFESFDRLEFLRVYINPAYKLLLDDQIDKNIELPALITHLPQAVNYEADNIFDRDFLNASYFGLDIPQLGANEEASVYLGKILFADPALSSDNQRSCISCHSPQRAFTDGVKRSTAFGKTGTIDRNSPTIINAIFADKYFYDLRAPHLLEQVNHVVGSEKEFNTSFNEIIEKLRKSDEYDSLFRAAFPHISTQRISQYTISFALAAYVQNVIALDSEFDRYVRYETNKISDDVRKGFNIFMGKAACATCHFPPTFSGLVPPVYTESESEVLGIPEDPNAEKLSADRDLGRYRNGWETEKADIYRSSFKTPTLRNIELTGPYMHNGSFPDLESVIDFYNNGGGVGHGLDFPHQTLPSDSLFLNEYEKSCLKEFMKSLTDTSGTQSGIHSLPAIPGLESRRIGGVY